MLLITLSDNLTLHLKPMPGIDYIKTFLYQSNCPEMAFCHRLIELGMQQTNDNSLL